MNIRTNNVPRDIIDGWELAATEREQFDYLDWRKLKNGQDSASFFRYRGELYDLGEFTRVEPNGELEELGWHGYQADSFSHATIVRYVEDGERVVVASCYWS